jgi:hypothetical protein
MLLLTDCVVDVSHFILSAIVLGQSLGSRLTKSQLKHVQTKCHVNSLSSNTTVMSISPKQTLGSEGRDKNFARDFNTRLPNSAVSHLRRYVISFGMPMHLSFYSI